MLLVNYIFYDVMFKHSSDVYYLESAIFRAYTSDIATNMRTTKYGIVTQSKKRFVAGMKNKVKDSVEF